MKQDYDEGFAFFTGCKNAALFTFFMFAVIAVAMGLAGCENPADTSDEGDKTEITAQSGSTVIINTDGSTTTVNQSQDEIKE